MRPFIIIEIKGHDITSFVGILNNYIQQKNITSEEYVIMLQEVVKIFMEAKSYKNGGSTNILPKKNSCPKLFFIGDI